VTDADELGHLDLVEASSDLRHVGAGTRSSSDNLTAGERPTGQRSTSSG
jgi:hypothetical protein